MVNKSMIWKLAPIVLLSGFLSQMLHEAMIMIIANKTGWMLEAIFFLIIIDLVFLYLYLQRLIRN